MTLVAVYVACFGMFALGACIFLTVCLGREMARHAPRPVLHVTTDDDMHTIPTSRLGIGQFVAVAETGQVWEWNGGVFMPMAVTRSELLEATT